MFLLTNEESSDSVLDKIKSYQIDLFSGLNLHFQ